MTKKLKKEREDHDLLSNPCPETLIQGASPPFCSHKLLKIILKLGFKTTSLSATLFSFACNLLFYYCF